MAPYHSGILHQGRDDDNDDSGDGYYHPAVIFFGLLLLCLCIMAPMIWMIWLMRNDNRDNVRTEAQLHRTRNWKNVKSSEQQRAAQQSTVQNGDGGEATAATRDLPRLPSAVAKLRKLASSTQQVVVSQSQLVWDSIARPFANITRPIPRRSRRHSRAGVSIDLPIMRQPAWQKLASGSVATIPSTTLGEISKPVSPEVDVAGVAGFQEHHHIGEGDSQIGLLGQHEVINGKSDADSQKPQAVPMVGLAMG